MESKARPREALHFYTRQDEVDPLHRTAVSLAKAVAMEDPEEALDWARSTKNSVLETMVQRVLKVLPAESQGFP